MKSLIAIFAIALGGATAAWPAPPAVLTTLRAIHALTNEEASHRLPVAFEATVSYSRGAERLLFVQDGGSAIFVSPLEAMQLVPGDRVFIRGVTRRSFRPIVDAKSVILLRHSAPPTPQPATFQELIRSLDDSMLVTVHAVVRAADMVYDAPGQTRSIQLQLNSGGGQIEAFVDGKSPDALKGLLDAEVEITGTVAGKFDDKMQETGVVLYVTSPANIKVIRRASTTPWSLPVMPIDRILTVYDVRDHTPRVHVQGTITYYEPELGVVIQNGAKSLWIATHTHEPLRVGDLADVTGFPTARDRMLSLSDGEILDTNVFQPLTPEPMTWKQLSYWSSNSPDGHLYDLVSIEGKVVTEVRQPSEDEYVLSIDGKLFTATFRHSFATAALPPMKPVPLGSTVRVTGICMIMGSNLINPGQDVQFYILMRSFDDITVVARPSLVNTRNLLLLIGILLIVVFAVIARGWALEHKVRRQTAAMSARTEAEAELERRRSRILEEISGTRPLVEILEEIAAMVSFMLHEAPCWCEIADGARLGNCPPHKSGLRVIQMEISGHAGLALGTLFAALDPLAPPDSEETPALSVGTRLATLAIETRHLYSDLRRRSEFDLLTDIHNRFSLESQLDALIEAASGEASREEGSEKAVRFGLIYIDLDEFKQVNDRYGHHIGDLYLQEVVLRMKHQLRSHDMLARLGGDEFAALLTEAHSRADIEEIAQRLKSCFDAPFVLDGNQFHGSASVGFALYPADGASKDSLLGVADAAMYRAKNRRRKTEIIQA